MGNTAINRLTAPAIVNPVEMEVSLPPCEKIVLSNGVELYMLNEGNEETMMLNWVFMAGSWYEQKRILAPATNFLLKNGTAKRSAFDVNEHFEYYGAYLNRSCYSETAEISLHCLNKHVAALLPVVAEMISEASFPDEEIAIYKQNAQQRLKVGLQKCDFVASRLIDASLYGEDHPYGRYSRLEDYTAINREDLLQFYDQHYRNGRCVIFAAGKLPRNLPQLLEDYFGQLPLHPFSSIRREHAIAIKPNAEKKHFVLNDPNGVQAAIRIARPFPNKLHPDFQKAVVLNNVFGGFFGSRLMANIREEKGYTYGIYSYLLNQVRESGWMISTEAGRDVYEATINEVYSEMEELREELIDEEELMMTRNYMIGSILGDLDGPFQVIARWKSMLLNDLDISYFHRGLEIIRHISAEELRELAREYLQPADFHELVVI